MKKRPTSISIISWLFIVLGGVVIITGSITLFTDLGREAMSQSVLPVPVQIIQLYGTAVVYLICGIGMLKGIGWSKYLYTLWGALTIILNLIAAGMSLQTIEGIVFYLVILFFLFRPNANQYFQNGNLTNAEEA